MEAFLRNKDYLLNYPAQKAEREEQAALMQANINNFFQPFRGSIVNAQLHARIDETRDQAIARLSKEILNLTEMLRLKSAELNSLVNVSGKEIVLRSPSNK